MRFITEDTSKGDVKDRLSLNLYVYCKGNPIRYFDPTGHAPGDLFETMDEAAYDFALTYNEAYITNNAEYGSARYITRPITKRYHQIETGIDIMITKRFYSYSVPNKGSLDGVIPNLLVKGKFIATIHTHGGYFPAYKSGNDEFSTGNFDDT